MLLEWIRNPNRHTQKELNRNGFILWKSACGRWTIHRNGEYATRCNKRNKLRRISLFALTDHHRGVCASVGLIGELKHRAATLAKEG